LFVKEDCDLELEDTEVRYEGQARFCCAKDWSRGNLLKEALVNQVCKTLVVGIANMRHYNLEAGAKEWG